MTKDEEIRKAAQAIWDVWHGEYGSVTTELRLKLGTLGKALQTDTPKNDHVPEFAREGGGEEEAGLWRWDVPGGGRTYDLRLLKYIRGLELAIGRLGERLLELENVPR